MAIPKEELIRMLTDAQLDEERAVPVFLRHLSTAIFWTGVTRQKSLKAKAFFEGLSNDSERHKKIVSDLLSKIKEDSRDAF